MLLDTNNIPFTELHSELLKKNKVRMLVCRLDQLHPIVSGNKLFKLHYFLEAATASHHRTLLTFGGAYSNHLIATAFACRQLGLKSIGIVRGEAAENISHTLAQCESYGMELHFIPRDEYKYAHKPEYAAKLNEQFGDFTLVPEGGYHPMGAAGAALIMDIPENKMATHICTAVGTATTLSGIIAGSNSNQEIIALPVLKNLHDLNERIAYLTNDVIPDRLTVWDEYHFGGYAKKTPALIGFMNDFYRRHQVPTDMVYTAKMMYGIVDKLQQGYFKSGSTVVCLHTGGLQGNDSLPEGVLAF
ncbi:1-aminocyclopropane-1-carboxylate deaminase/D-cysteine desulfhydrase [Ferruginibacter sp. HRS2-29]|uniref:1-aminocyclopropane-1-carboxylate deaminase/D-cysteine desulfhydrase n=1 Tax=Ferruginibacter sp. HRS2-29 TaxID=2487334 RepID=UPI0020CDC86D|nr:pyridoxal-phosphate dependent enzyme [Ferruginibacter sp. HRS2-29]MCP9751352.1 pyridoxal-phosphate dependent enzyme [Ferruginibacter sp. HRS2-29]